MTCFLLSLCYSLALYNIFAHFTSLRFLTLPCPHRSISSISLITRTFLPFRLRPQVSTCWMRCSRQRSSYPQRHLKVTPSAASQSFLYFKWRVWWSFHKANLRTGSDRLYWRRLPTPSLCERASSRGGDRSRGDCERSCRCIWNYDNGMAGSHACLTRVSCHLSSTPCTQKTLIGFGTYLQRSRFEKRSGQYWHR